ncbi:MAG: PEGA domain-containing protein, partial [Polyangiaceae bacterium]|nr:PEGA domain-containing protein [Polyangiaceae bacterium]
RCVATRGARYHVVASAGGYAPSSQWVEGGAPGACRDLAIVLAAQRAQLARSSTGPAPTAEAALPHNTNDSRHKIDDQDPYDRDRLLSLRAPLALAAVLASALPSAAKAAEPDATEEGRTRFRRGVELFHEGDYRNVLIEFNRAYAIAPQFKILYNIGQTCFELQDYACALRSLRDYRAAADSSVSASRRAETDAQIAQLQARVAYVTVETNVPGAEISVDDLLVGKAPLTAPLLVSAGRRRFSAASEGKPQINHVVDVAGGESTKVRFDFPAEKTPAAAGPTAPPRARPPSPSRPPSSAPFWISIGISSTLAAGAATFGLLALRSDRDADRALDVFPTNTGAIESAQAKSTRFALVADILGAAAIVGVASSIYFGVRLASSGGPKPTELRAGASGLGLSGAF